MFLEWWVLEGVCGCVCLFVLATGETQGNINSISACTGAIFVGSLYDKQKHD